MNDLWSTPSDFFQYTSQERSSSFPTKVGRDVSTVPLQSGTRPQRRVRLATGGKPGRKEIAGNQGQICAGRTERKEKKKKAPRRSLRARSSDAIRVSPKDGHFYAKILQEIKRRVPASWSRRPTFA